MHKKNIYDFSVLNSWCFTSKFGHCIYKLVGGVTFDQQQGPWQAMVVADNLEVAILFVLK